MMLCAELASVRGMKPSPEVCCVYVEFLLRFELVSTGSVMFVKSLLEPGFAEQRCHSAQNFNTAC